MERAFLSNFKVGNEPLPDVIIDAILEENKRDLSAAKADTGGTGGNSGKMFTQEDVNRIISERLNREKEKTFADYESVKEQLKTAKESLDAFKDIDVNDLKGQIAKLQNDLAAKDTEYNNKIADMAFDSVLDAAIRAAKGKNTKAIRALLDVDALKKSKNQTEDVKRGIEDLKKENGYLFDSDPIIPPYAPGPGAVPPNYTFDPIAAAFRH